MDRQSKEIIAYRYIYIFFVLVIDTLYISFENLRVVASVWNKYSEETGDNWRSTIDKKKVWMGFGALYSALKSQLYIRSVEGFKVRLY